eukprot:g12394.t1
MKVNRVVVTLLFLVAAMQQPGGALAVRQHPEAVQQDMFRRLAAITGMDALKLLDKPHFPVAMNGYGHTVAAGPLRLVRNYLRWDSDMLATIVMKDDGWAPMLVLFAHNDVDSAYDVIELVHCAVTRVQDRRMLLSKGEESWEFIAPSFQQREAWADAFSFAISEDAVSLAMPVHRQQGVLLGLDVVQQDSALCRGYVDEDPSELVMTCARPDVGIRTLKVVGLAGSEVTRVEGRDRNILLTKGEGQVDSVSTFMRDLRGLQATLDADRFTLVVAPPPSFRCSKDKPERRVGTKSVPITSLRTITPGKDNTFIVKNPKRSDTVKLRPTYRDRDDWMVALEEVKAVYDRSLPEVAGGVAARERCATVLFGKKLPAVLCRFLFALARAKAWLAGAAAEWGRTSKTRRARGGSKDGVDADAWAITLNGEGSIDQQRSLTEGFTKDLRSPSAEEMWSI